MYSQYPYPSEYSHFSLPPTTGYHTSPPITSYHGTVVPPYQTSDRSSQSFRIDDILLHGKGVGTVGHGPPPAPPPQLHSGMYPVGMPSSPTLPLYRGTHHPSFPVPSLSHISSSTFPHGCSTQEKECDTSNNALLNSLPVYFRLKPNLRTANGRKCRKPRTVFSELQLVVLEREFTEHKYLSTPQRTKLADRLGLNQTQVKTWFQNRRMKWKKESDGSAEYWRKDHEGGSCRLQSSSSSGENSVSRIVDTDNTSSNTSNNNTSAISHVLNPEGFRCDDPSRAITRL